MDKIILKIADGIYLKQDTGCWIWTKGKNGKGKTSGYGYITLLRPRKNVLLHRLSYEIFNGKFNKKLLICHKCDTPACINPEHLFTGTIGDNMRDRKNKGRYNPKKGDEHPNTKISDMDVTAIRKEYKHGGVTQTELSKKYNTTTTNISAIVNNKSRII